MVKAAVEKACLDMFDFHTETKVLKKISTIFKIVLQPFFRPRKTSV